MTEADLYRKALADAIEHLKRWEDLGKQLHREDDPGWQLIYKIRQTAVKQLGLLIAMTDK